MPGIESRRRFLGIAGTTIAAASIPTGMAGAAPAPADMPIPAPPGPASPTAAKLYRDALVLDANTLASFGIEFEHPGQLAALMGSGINALKSTLGGANGTFEETVADIAAAQALIDRHPDRLLKVARHADIARAVAESKVGVIFSFEAASMLEGKLDRIDLFRNLDVLVMQLSYNHKTPFGCGCLDGDSDGVSELGRQAIARMNKLGVALDLSHANVQTTADGIDLSNKPPVFTHTGCRAVFDHPRNKRDVEMKALADAGGVMGIYMLPFLTPPDRQPMLADYMQHMLHALDVCGEDHVGIGTDSMFFTVTGKDLEAVRQQEAARLKQGVGAPGENRPPYIPDINTPRKLEYVADALLKKGYGGRVAEKVLGANFSRVFKAIWV